MQMKALWSRVASCPGLIMMHNSQGVQTRDTPAGVIPPLGGCCPPSPLCGAPGLPCMRLDPPAAKLLPSALPSEALPATGALSMLHTAKQNRRNGKWDGGGGNRNGWLPNVQPAAAAGWLPGLLPLMVYSCCSGRGGDITSSWCCRWKVPIFQTQWQRRAGECDIISAHMADCATKEYKTLAVSLWCGN